MLQKFYLNNGWTRIVLAYVLADYKPKNPMPKTNLVGHSSNYRLGTFNNKVEVLEPYWLRFYYL